MTIFLDPIDPKPLDILTNDRDLLRDMFIYLGYVREHSIKRMTRTNEIPRADLVRIAKLLNIDLPEKDEWKYVRPYWVDFVDRLALRLHLVSYDLEGEYRGQTSREPSFIENFITVDETRLNKFLDLSPANQEKSILDVLNRAKSSHSYDESYFNEFFHYGPLGYLDVFESWGSAIGVVPTLNFPEIRTFLLDLLKNCPSGQWFSVQSLIGYLKANHPYFLIPQFFPKSDRWGNSIGRYDNFHEGKSFEAHEKTVPPGDPDAFERVEGRYIERFLEYIPLIMRFVDLAYDPQGYSGLFPSRGMLKAFRVNERFLRLFQNEEVQPRVTVQPNFDVIIESDFYPARMIEKVAKLGEQVSKPADGHGAYVGIFQLKKAAVASALVQQPDLNIMDMLKDMTGHDLPQNVQIELEEWAGHADQFILYENFAMLETTNLPVEVERYIVEKISPSINLIRSPEKVFALLEKQGHVPLRMIHLPEAFALLEETTTSIFPKESAQDNALKQARQVKISRRVSVNYQFPDQEAFVATQKILAELRCPFQTDLKAHIITIQQTEQTWFDKALAKLADDFLIEVE
jgi:hypothetical protein